MVCSLPLCLNILHFRLLGGSVMQVGGNLEKLAARVRAPADYFSGRGGDPWCWPRNLIAFARNDRRELQRRTFRSRLHSRYVLVVNLRTAGTLNLDSTPYRLRPGECHLIFPHQLHTYHDLDADSLRWLFITFEIPDDTRLRPLRQTTVALDSDMTGLLERFLTGYRKSGTPVHRLQAILSSFLLDMVERAGRDTPRAVRTPRPSAGFLEAIHRHHSRTLPDALTIKQLAGLMHLSESRLRARFRETFGLGLGGYLQNLRLLEAVAMMKHSQATLTEIALACGFGSSATFSRAFRNWSGATPRSFRISVQGSNG